VDTSAIRYRVADFLKKQPPFHVMEETDLLDLAQQGRVRFFEPNQYILSQGASRYQIYVIQQGTVSLWDERSAEPRLLDVRGAGDLLGADQLQQSRVYPYAATSSSDVLVYSFPTEDFHALVEKYPDAANYVSAYGNLASNDRQSRERNDPQNVALSELAAGQKPLACDAQTSIRDAARHLLTSAQDAILVQDSQQRARGILTLRSLVEWIASGSGSVQQPVAALLKQPPATIRLDASAADSVLAMNANKTDALAVTSDGTLDGSVRAIVTSRSLEQIFGDRPTEILREIDHAGDVRALDGLNRRGRRFALRYLNDASSTDWLARFTCALDTGIVRRIIAVAVREPVDGCWCFCGASGRGEVLPRLSPEIVLIANDDRAASILPRVLEGIGECGYLPAATGPFDPEFYAASVEEWRERYLGWVNDPILKEIYLARPFFDLRPIFGNDAGWDAIEATVMSAINREFLHVVANDCLSTLPPLTFFQNAVLDETGEETQVFRLEETALRPLVDVGRVFGLATRKVFGTSTLERFATAQQSLPEQASIFREASEALRIVLWQQGRVGIREGTPGSEVPPALLGSYDRQLLKSAFRSILRLIEFTGDLEWLKVL
jgi:CBS domain-containing protein